MSDVIEEYITGNLAEFSPNTTAQKAIEILSGKKKRWGSLDYVFLVEDKKLIGMVSIENLFAAQPQNKLSDLSESELVTIKAGSDKEEAAILAISKNVFELPVIDKNGQFLGIVEPASLMKILHEENTEDLLKAAGIHPAKTITDTIRLKAAQLVKYRLPWLLLGLGGGILATSIVSFFEKSLEKQIALAFFIPIIVYMSDAAGTQTETLFIRSIALKQVNTRKYLAKEIVVGFSMGLIIGLLLFLFTIIWLKDFKIATVVGLSMIANITIAMIVAVFVPFLLFKLKKDPALGGGPFATVIQDILSLIIYFGIATIIFSAFK